MGNVSGCCSDSLFEWGRCLARALRCSVTAFEGDFGIMEMIINGGVYLGKDSKEFGLYLKN